MLSQYDDPKKVGSQVANWDRTQGHDEMQNLLQAHPGLIAARELSSVKVGGFNGSPDAVAAIKADELRYTVLQ